MRVTFILLFLLTTNFCSKAQFKIGGSSGVNLSHINYAGDYDSKLGIQLNAWLTKYFANTKFITLGFSLAKENNKSYPTHFLESIYEKRSYSYFKIPISIGYIKRIRKISALGSIGSGLEVNYRLIKKGRSINLFDIDSSYTDANLQFIQSFNTFNYNEKINYSRITTQKWTPYYSINLGLIANVKKFNYIINFSFEHKFLTKNSNNSPLLPNFSFLMNIGFEYPLF